MQKQAHSAIPTEGQDERNEPLTWERFNKRGYFVLLTLIVSSIVAVWVTKETTSWKSATEAARKERDAETEIITRQNAELDKLRPDNAALQADLKNVKAQLEVASANASTYRDRYNQLSGQKTVSPDVKDLQSKLDSATTQAARSREELARVQGDIQSSKDNAETYKSLYEKMMGERDEANKRVQTIQGEKDDLQNQISKLKSEGPLLTPHHPTIIFICLTLNPYGRHRRSLCRRPQPRRRIHPRILK